VERIKAVYAEAKQRRRELLAQQTPAGDHISQAPDIPEGKCGREPTETGPSR
jgi:hypothetical protein